MLRLFFAVPTFRPQLIKVFKFLLVTSSKKRFERGDTLEKLISKGALKVLDKWKVFRGLFRNCSSRKLF